MMMTTIFETLVVVDYDDDVVVYSSPAPLYKRNKSIGEILHVYNI